MSEQIVLGFGAGRTTTGLDLSAWSKSLAFPVFGKVSSLEQNAWSDSLVFPSYAVVASVVFLAIHFSISLLRNRRKQPTGVSGYLSVNEQSKVKGHVDGLGGWVIFGYMVLRALVSLALLGLSVATLIGGLSRNTLLENGSICLTFGYSSVLALLSLFTKRRWSTILIRHVNTVHLVAFVVYAYRDLYPLTIFDQTPQDASEGSVLWARIGLLTLATIVIPLVIPRQYVPYNPEKPEEPNPEQTASLLSLTLYTFMDPIVFKAWKASKVQLEREDLPHLPDYDHSYNLRARMFGHLDPMKVKRRNLFFSLMRAFRTDYMVLFTMLFVRALSGFTTPVAVKGLLNYIEQKGIGVPTKPWVWILVLLLGPTIESLSFEWYIFIATRALVRTEAILTQLVFEHALRIRMKSETNDTSKEKQQQISSPEDTSKPATPTPPESASQTDSDSDSSNGGHGRRSVSENATLHAPEESTDSGSTIVGGSGSSRIPSEGSTSSGSIKKSKKPGPPPPPATPVPTTPSPSPSGGAAPGEDDKKKSSAANLVGRMNNLVTSDLQSIVDARDFGMLVVYTPIQIVLCIIFLYQVLGWSSFLGLATIIILFPLPGYLAKLVQRAQKAKMKKTDARIETVTETMNVLRMVKMFGWERLMNERIAAKREEELTYIKRMRLLDLATMLTNHIIPIITMLVTYATYTLVMKEPLTASKVFSSMVVFEKFQFQLRILLFVMNQSIAAKVSLDRITDFLYNTELLDTYKQKDNGTIEEVSTSIIPSESSQDIGFRNATFTWSNDSDDGTLTPSRRRFQLRIEEELLFKRGCINLIVGPTGCGKTSMLMALLSEMHFVQTNPDSWFNLPRDKGVAYAAQESWVQNATIKDNIVFRSEFNEARYKKVLHQCALERDLTLFEAGDATEVGEKGLTLSGGQKARITLARAVYSDAEIILLDDVLAALDVHTSKWIVERCFKGDLIKGRTVLLVTHNLVLTQPIAGFVVSMKDGKIASQGTVSDALDHNRSLVAEARQEEQELQIAEETIDVTAPVADGSKSDGKLIIAEEVEIGHVGWPAMRLFIKALGGNHVFLFFLTYMGMIGLSEFAEIGQTWFLGYWAEQYEKMNPEDVNVVFYLSSYVLILAFVIGTFAIAFIVNMFGAIRSSRSIHKQLMTSILGTGHLVFKMQC